MFNEMEAEKRRLMKNINEEKNQYKQSMYCLEALLGSKWSRSCILAMFKAKTDDEIAQDYTKIISQKRLSNIANATAKTSKERQFEAYLRKNINQDFRQSVWIGPFNFDFLIPTVAAAPYCSPRLKGLVIEIDGPIHNVENKMVKDELKSEFLKRLEIGHVSLNNEDCKDSRFSQLCNSVSETYWSDTKGKKKLFRMIHIVTILCSSRDFSEISRKI